jgi:hypothetical protein
MTVRGAFAKAYELYAKFLAGLPLRRREDAQITSCTPTIDLVPSAVRVTARYESEADLVREFVAAVQSTNTPFPAVKVGQEFNYNDGRTDVLLSSAGELIAFEAKLTHWKVALHQAYRNTSYAHRSYVLLPTSVAERVVLFSSEFERRRVGLCTIADGSIRILHSAPRVEPPMPWVSDRAVSYLSRQAG